MVIVKHYSLSHKKDFILGKTAGTKLQIIVVTTIIIKHYFWDSIPKIHELVL